MGCFRQEHWRANIAISFPRALHPPPTQGLNLHGLHWQVGALPLSHQGSPLQRIHFKTLEHFWVHHLPSSQILISLTYPMSHKVKDPVQGLLISPFHSSLWWHPHVQAVSLQKVIRGNKAANGPAVFAPLPGLGATPATTPVLEEDSVWDGGKEGLSVLHPQCCALGPPYSRQGLYFERTNKWMFNGLLD